MKSACIIGISGYGDVHYNDLMSLAEAGKLRALGATVINQREESEKCARLRSRGCELFTDYRAMLDRFNGRIDLCFVPTGIHWHAEMSMAAMRAGADVFVEKPAAATVDEVREMRACERETGRFVAVGYQHIYARETEAMKRAILEGKIGRLQTIKCRVLWPRPDSYYARNDWAGRLKVGERWVLDSPFNNANAHQLNMMCFLAGTEFRKSARPAAVEAELYSARDIESADTACIRVTTAEGVRIYFFGTHSCNDAFGPEIVVQGDQGRISWNSEKMRIEARDGKVSEQASENLGEVRKTIMARVLDRLQGGDAFVCDLAVAGAQTLCANGAHESSRVNGIGEDFVERLSDGDSLQPVIVGIGRTTEMGFTEEKLFSELGVGWARRGKTFSLENYAGFGKSGGATG